MSDTDPLIGVKLGTWVLADRIGSGGMGVVYRAQDRKSGGVVAVKVLPAELADEPELLARFKRECTSQATLNHPNLVKVLSAGFENTVHFLVMEYVPGRTVLSFLREREPAALDLAVHVGLSLLSALAYVHQRELLHRDIKPGNVFLTATGTVKLMDFGLVKDLQKTMITVAGEKLGTPRYMAPEALLQGQYTKLSDLYQVALMVYELLTLKIPYEAPGLGNFLNQLCTHGPTPPARYRSAIPEPLSHWLLRSLAFEPEQRFPDAQSAAKELEAVARRTDIFRGPQAEDAPPAGWPARAPVGTKAKPPEGKDRAYSRDASVEQFPASPMADARALRGAGDAGGEGAGGDGIPATDDEATLRIRPKRQEAGNRLPRPGDGPPGDPLAVPISDDNVVLRTEAGPVETPAKLERSARGIARPQNPASLAGSPAADGAPTPPGRIGAVRAPSRSDGPLPSDLSAGQPRGAGTGRRPGMLLALVGACGLLGVLTGAVILWRRAPAAVLSSGQPQAPTIPPGDPHLGLPSLFHTGTRASALPAPPPGAGPQRKGRIGFTALPAAELEPWTARVAALAGGPDGVAALAADFQVRHGFSGLRERTLGPMLALRLHDPSSPPRIEQLAALDRDPRESPLAWQVFADAAGAAAPGRALAYQLRALTWLLSCGRDAAQAAGAGMPAALERAERAGGGGDWAGAASLAARELLSSTGAAATPSTSEALPLASFTRDPDLAGNLTRIRDLVHEARDMTPDTDDRTPAEVLKQCVTSFRELLWQVEGQKRRLEWGVAEENGPCGLVREMCALVPTGQGGLTDSPFRPVLLSFARSLAGAEPGSGEDAGYWEAIALAGRAVNDAAAEERALLHALAAAYRRPAGARPDSERRIPMRERLIELVRRRLDAERAELESLPPPWPPVGTRREILLRHALVLAVWSLASPPASEADPALRRDRLMRAIASARDLAHLLGEDDAAPALEAWAPN